MHASESLVSMVIHYLLFNCIHGGDQGYLNGLFIEVKARGLRLVLGWVDLQRRLALCTQVRSLVCVDLER